MKADDFYIEKHVNLLIYTNRSNQRPSVKSKTLYCSLFTITPKSPITYTDVVGLLDGIYDKS